MENEIIEDNDIEDYNEPNKEDLFNDDNIENFDENFEFLEILGEGENQKGKWLSLKARSLDNNKLYFIKKFDEKLLEERKDLIQILNLIKQNKHPNIINQIKFFFQKKSKSYYIIDEFLNSTDLQDYLKAYEEINKPIEETILWNIFFQCASILKFLHSHDIILQNIKLDNFLINEYNLIKLGNFTYSAICSDENKLNSQINSGLLYQSPEMINGLKYGKKTDIFSLGVIFYKLCFNQFPFDICKGEKGFIFFPKIKKKNTNISKKMEKIINKMLEFDEKNRPDSKELYQIILENKNNNKNSIFKKNK